MQTKLTQYGLKWDPRRHLRGKYIVLCGVLTAFSTILSWLAVITIPGGFLGIGALYFASIFYAVSTYFFGGWGLIASFIGTVLGAGILQGIPLLFAIPFGLANVLEPLVPFILIRSIGQKLGIDPLGSNILARPRNVILFITFGAFLPPLISGIWGSWILTLAGLVPRNAFWPAVASWAIGAAALLALFVPFICKSISIIVKKKDIACHGIWS